jgi:hypothetical protein
MTVPAGTVTSFLPNHLDVLGGALLSDVSSDAGGFEHPIAMQIRTSSDAKIAKRRCTNTSFSGSLIVRWPIVHLEDAEGVMPMMVGGNESCPQGWHGAELKSPFVRTKGLVGFVSQISSSPGYIDADRRRNRFPVPAPLQERRVD